MHPPLAIVGTGAVTQALGLALNRAGVTVAGIAGRDLERARTAAARIGSGGAAVRIAEIPSLSSHVLIATTDARISDVARELAGAGLRGGLALHTSGTRGTQALAALADRGVSCGVFHPLQTVSAAAEATSFAGVTFAVTGHPSAVAWGTSLAEALHGHVIHPRDDRMPLYHASAVLAGNGIAALLDASLNLMAEAGVEPSEARQALGPLMRTALDNALSLTPQASVTGPLVRGDVATVRRHIEALANVDASTRELYRAVSEQLLEIARRRGLTHEVIAALAAAIAASPQESTHDV